MAQTRSRRSHTTRDFRMARSRSRDNLNRLEAEQRQAEQAPLPRFHVIGNPDRGFVIMDGARNRIAFRFATDSREIVADEADVLNALDERTPLREAEELWTLAHGIVGYEDPPCLGDGDVAAGNDPHCRFALAEPTFHRCTNRDGGPVQPGQSCWRESRTSMLETQLDADEQRDHLADTTTAYDDEVAAS